MGKKNREYLGQSLDTRKCPLCSSDQEKLDAYRVYGEEEKPAYASLDEMLALLDK